MNARAVKFWKGLFPLIQRFCFDSGLSFNRVVNLALIRFLRGDDVSLEVLKLEAKKLELLREEVDLRRTWNTIARSGAYLPQFVARTLKAQEAKALARVEYARSRGFNFDRRNNLDAVEDLPREGAVPLKALSKEEEDLFKRICARREAIAQELIEIEKKLLPTAKFRFKLSKSRRRRRDIREYKSVNECADSENKEMV